MDVLVISSCLLVSPAPIDFAREGGRYKTLQHDERRARLQRSSLEAR
jgi:hypothetical protein